jgi:hypothetical protein
MMRLIKTVPLRVNNQVNQRAASISNSNNEVACTSKNHTIQLHNFKHYWHNY